MPSKNEVLQELAYVVRSSSGAALWVCGYLAQPLTVSELQEALEGAREAAEVWGPTSHLEAYRERWGRLPG